MKSFVLYIRESNRTATLDYVSDSPDQDGSISGRLLNPVFDNAATFIDASRGGSLFTHLPGQKYTVTGLSEYGTFKLVPVT